MHGHPLNDPALTVGLAVAAGVLCQVLARLFHIPGIVLLLAAGVALGPEALGWVRPEVLGDGLNTVIGFAVAVILFEGGMNLDVRRLRKEALVIRRLITWGALITAVGGTALARWVMGWSWALSVLFGTLVIVTGPTVVTPLLRRIRVRRSVHNVLEAEGVLIDAVGALLAVVALEVVLSPEGAWLEAGLGGLLRRWGAGLAVGAVGGLMVGIPLKQRGIPDGLENVFALGGAIGVFAVSNALAPESGVLAAIVAGMVVANMRTEAQRDLLEFKEQLTTVFVGVLFVLLAADVRLQAVVSLGAPGLLTVALLMLVVRPVNVFASTWGSELSTRERLFISWLAPRGIVAAAVASLFARSLTRAGIDGGTELRALVFAVIAATVVVQGLSGGWVAGLLGLRQEPRGFLLLGANPLARLVARVLKAQGQDVALIDSNSDNCRLAEEEGFRVLYGSALDERTVARGEPGARLACLGMTQNEGVNLLFARTARERLSAPRALVALHRRRVGVQPSDVMKAHADVLFATPVDLDQWFLRAQRQEVELWLGELREDAKATSFEQVPEGLFLPITVTGKKEPHVVGTLTALNPRDRLVAVLNPQQREAAIDWLTSQGWESVQTVPQAAEALTSAR